MMIWRKKLEVQVDDIEFYLKIGNSNKQSNNIVIFHNILLPYL